MDIRHIAVKEGITLHYIPTNRFTSNQYSVHFVMPIEEKNAALYNLLSKVVKKGSARFPSQEAIAKRSEELYSASIMSAVTKVGESITFSLFSSALDNRYAFDGINISEGTSCLLYSLLNEPLTEETEEGMAFVAQIVAREKETLLDTIRAQINNKSAYALKRCRDVMCEGEPYRIPLCGSIEDVEAITPRSLYTAYLDLIRAATVEVYYVGSEDETLVFERTKTLLQGLLPRKKSRFEPVIVASAEKVKRVAECVKASQGKLVMGFRTACTAKDEDSAALRVFDAVFGSSPVSKLFMNVREKRSLCYYCSSSVDFDKGILFVSAGIENKNAKATEHEILAQLSEICSGHISENELLCAKESIYDYLRSFEDSAASMERWSLVHTLRESTVTAQALIEQVSRVTLSDVVRVAGRITLDTVYFLEGKDGETHDV